jgi:hypothetical protein
MTWPKMMLRDVGPIVTLFIWWGDCEWVLHLEWPSPSHTGGGKWQW